MHHLSRLALLLAFGALACTPTNRKNNGNGDDPECANGQELCDGECVPLGSCGGSDSTSEQRDTDTEQGQSTSTGQGQDTSTGVASNTGVKSDTKTNSNTGTGTGTKSATQPASNTVTASATQTKAPASPNCTDVSYTAPYTQKSQGATTRLKTPENKEYLVQANWWHKYTDQTVAIDGLSFTVGNPSGTAVSGGDNYPMGYPSIFIGAYQDRVTALSKLPIQVSAIKSVNTIFSTNALSKGTSNYNVAYDVWFTPTSKALTSETAPPSGGAYLMVWYFQPSNRQPRGSNEHPGHTVSGVSGSWNVWVDHSNPPCISYVSTSPIEKLDFDLNKFIQDATNNGYGYSSGEWKNKYLSVIFAGFEIWGGGNGLQAKAFCANVQ